MKPLQSMERKWNLYSLHVCYGSFAFIYQYL